jgi:tetratricopeptide (TPR) repeat protein
VTPPPIHDENHARELMNQAFACLDRHDLNGAREIARQLANMRHSGTFEIMAEVFMMAGDLEKAIELLEDGTKTAPTVWLLWQSLGNAYTQHGDFEKAQQAYGQALRCPQVDSSSIHFNRGMAFARDRRYPEALEAFALVTSSQLAHKARSFQVSVHNDMHRFDLALELGKQLLEEEARDPEDRARVHAQLGRACLQGYNDLESARRHAEVARKMWPPEPTAAFVLRALDQVEARRAEG